MPEPVHNLVDHLFPHEAGGITAALTRALGPHYLDLAEEASQEVLIRALQVWPFRWIPEYPGAWLHRTARHIVSLYDALLQLKPSPLVRLNRAVALFRSGQLNEALRDCGYWSKKKACVATLFSQLRRPASKKRLETLTLPGGPMLVRLAAR